MNFTFVTHKGARPERSELVKSHVMRESQRRRKEARKHQTRSENVPQRSQSAEDASPMVNSNYHETTEASLEFTARTTTVVDRTNWEPSDPATYSEFLAGLRTCQGLWDGPQNSDSLEPAVIDMTPWSEEPFILYHSFETSPVLSGHTSLDPTLTVSPVEHLPSLSYFDQLGAGTTLDTQWTLSQSLEQNSQMTDCHENSPLLCGANPMQSNPHDYWLQATGSRQKILFCASLYYRAIKDILQGKKGDGHDHSQTRTLHSINRALADPSMRPSEDAIAAVISLCIYENVLGSEDVVTHLEGLQQMINMKESNDNLSPDKWQYMVEMANLQDMIHACSSNVEPFMFDITSPSLRDMRSEKFEYFYPQSPLRVVNDARFTQPPTELRSSFQVLADAFDGFEMLCIETFDEDTANAEANTFQERREKFLEVLHQKGTGADEDAEFPLVELKARDAVSTAARIHFRACAYRIQHNEDVNEEDMRRLRRLLRSIDPRFWKVGYYVYMWILLTGAAASHGHPRHRPYFVSELMRLGLSIGFFDWKSFRLIMGNFLWLQRFLQRDEQQRHAETSRDAIHNF
ncbi:hypothetical protein K491DRAFT_84284 [Lophiostoma macrostomum CBS 122681]|uniref:Uncharacterized protein n=1 Tax=Lophiostoma macrostomum CBS 122681 TaxID=1314788 RepID=A0A6A6SVV6_9PLEO|nr:hypothetical protein K491DRAFT_84284 [Lophiostoma macrostomum CBS 122681]